MKRIPPNSIIWWKKEKIYNRSAVWDFVWAFTDYAPSRMPRVKHASFGGWFEL